MSQESSSYMKRHSYNTAPSNNPYASKSHFRYSDQSYPRTSSVPTRRYATLEESEAVLPVFTTPSNMYLQQYFQQQQQQQQVYSYSNQQQQQNYNYNRNSTSPPPAFNEPVSQQQYRQPQEPSNTTAKDEIVAQLVDMGFDVSRAKLAVDATGSNSLQDALDLLIQSDHLSPVYAERAPSVPEKDHQTNGYSTPPQPPPHGIPYSKQQNNPPTPSKDHIHFSPPIPSKDSPQQSYFTPPIPPPRNTTQSTSAYSTADYPRPSSTSSTPLSASSKPTNQQDYTRPSSAYSNPMAQQNHSPALSSGTTSQPGYSTPSFSPPSPPKTDPAIVFANKERKQGNFSFNKGQFRDSESSYSLAINALPEGHGDIPLLLNNRAAALIKQGKYKECLRDCSLAIEIATKNAHLPTTPIMQETSTTMKAQWIKALHRKACALEGLKEYQEAIQVYEEYVQVDGSVQGTQGIARCQKALQKIKDLETINQSKAVQEMRDREKKKEAEDAERLMHEDRVNEKIDAWKAGKEKNLRALLSSLEIILWESVQWKGVLMSDLYDPKKCKITYMKAIARVHPDKITSNSTIEQRMLASGIFTTLNQAWDVFKTENDL